MLSAISQGITQNEYSNKTRIETYYYPVVPTEHKPQNEYSNKTRIETTEMPQLEAYGKTQNEYSNKTRIETNLCGEHQERAVFSE